MNAPSILARMAVATTVAIVPVFAAPAVAATPQVAPNVFDGQSGTATVKGGQTFVVALPSNPTTGYSWGTPRFDHAGVATFVGSAYQHPGAPRPGAGGTQLLILKAGAPGTVMMTVNYARRWEKNMKPARSVALKITVNGM